MHGNQAGTKHGHHHQHGLTISAKRRHLMDPNGKPWIQCLIETTEKQTSTVWIALPIQGPIFAIFSKPSTNSDKILNNCQVSSVFIWFQFFDLKDWEYSLDCFICKQSCFCLSALKSQERILYKYLIIKIDRI